VHTRLRRSDPRTGFLIAIAGTLLVVSAVFSFASGIFHPYYVAMVAPWAAALVGAGVGMALAGRFSRFIAPALLVGALITELVVLHSDVSGDLSWAKPVAVAGTVLCGLLLALSLSRRVRLIVLAVGAAALLAAPATWAAQTLGHATSGTFPTGGPASAQTGFGGGRGGFGGFGGAAGGPGTTGAGSRSPLQSLFGSSSSSSGGASGSGAAGALPSGAPAALKRLAASGGFGAGGGFGSSDASLNAAASWAEKHGGGTVAVESQSTAASAILAGHSNVAGIGGFSGKESSVTLAWIDQEVSEGRLTYILAESASAAGGFSDGRTGSASAIAAAEKTATKLTITSGGQTFTLYKLKA
jgi:hypothetical protein